VGVFERYHRRLPGRGCVSAYNWGFLCCTHADALASAYIDVYLHASVIVCAPAYITVHSYRVCAHLQQTCIYAHMYLCVYMYDLYMSMRLCSCACIRIISSSRYMVSIHPFILLRSAGLLLYANCSEIQR
jgi:hypothetical protein